MRRVELILEIDGADHFTAEGRERDRVRDDFLESQGYRVVRIAGYDVLGEPSLCLQGVATVRRGHGGPIYFFLFRTW